MINPTVNFLKNTFREEDFYLAIRAFRENKHIWNALHDSKTLDALHTKLGAVVSNWSPTNIALIALGYDNFIKDIKNQALLQRSEAGYKAATAFEILLSNNNLAEPAQNLKFALFAALGIREKWLIQDEADNNLLINSLTTNTTILSTVVTLFYGMIPNPQNLIHILLHSNNHQLNSTAIHTILSQPLAVTKQAELLLPGLQTLTPYHRSTLLIELNQRFPSLAQNIAEGFLNRTAGPDTGALDPYQQILHHVEKTELLKITQQFDKAMPSLEQIWDATTRLQADLAAQIAQAATRSQDQETATKAIRKVNQFESLINDDKSSKEITLALINTGSLPQISQQAPVTKSLSEKSANAAVLLSKSKHAYQNNQLDNAKELAQQAYLQIEHAVNNPQIDANILLKSFTPDFFQTAIEILINTNLLQEANTLANITDLLLPNQPEIISLSGKISKLSGNLDAALEHAYIAAALSPNNTDFQKQLISLLKEAGNFNEAGKIADRYLEKLSSPSIEDFALAAECAFLNNELNKSEVFCQNGLALSPKNMELLILIGKIKAADSQIEEAIKWINHAIEAEPNHITPWLVIADLLLQNNQHEIAIEKLISASKIAPNDPNIFLKIGKIYLQQNKNPESLEYLNQAHELIQPDTAPTTQKDIKIHLGQTLLNAGYFDDAKLLLEKAHAVHPTDEKIAHLFGHALMKTKEFDKARNTFEIPIQAGTKNTCILLDFAATLLELGKNTSSSIKYINQALQIDVDNPRAKILKAHATAKTGNHKQAIQLYQDALLTDLGKSPDHFVELITGIAHSANEDNQPEVALTFLKEAIQKLPNNLTLQKLLCEALNLSNLHQEAYSLLLEIYENHNHNLNLLLWIADQAIALKEMQFSNKILDQALQIAPYKAEIIVRLGYIQLETGQMDQARSTFEKLFSANNTAIKELKMAANALITLGDIATSIPYIEKALEISNYRSKDLLEELTNLHLQLGQYHPALNTIEKHLELDSTNPDLWTKQSEIFTNLRQPEAALDAIFTALQYAPESAEVHAKTAQLLRQNKDFNNSLKHITKALKLNPENNAYKIIAATIYQDCLMVDSAGRISAEIDFSIENEQSLLSLAEIYLDNLDTPDIDLVKKIVKLEEKSARISSQLLAIQSRILTVENKLDKADQTFIKAVERFKSSPPEEFTPLEKSKSKLSIGKAALALQKWEQAIQLGSEAARTPNAAPSILLFLVQTIVNRAEYQQNCRAVKCTTNAPGPKATNAEAIKTFLGTIKALKIYENISDETQKQIEHWEDRGKWALNISEPKTPIIFRDHTDLAAYIAANRRIGIPPTIQSDWNKWLTRPAVMFQLSLALTITDLNEALNLAEESISGNPAKPLYYANLAYIAKRLSKHQKALKAINYALSTWENEPTWHELAAQIHKEMDNPDQAIKHLEIAVKLNEENPKLLYSLAQTYSDNQMPGKAIQLFESAIEINPVDTASWIGLAKAQLITEDYERATDSIDKAIQLDNSLPSLLTAAEISQKQNNMRKANKYLNQALLLQPHSNSEIKNLTDLLINQRRSKEALEKLDDFIKASHTPIPLMLQKANILGSTKGKREKQEFLVLLAQENPKNPEILTQLTFSYIENSQYPEAIRTGQYALKTDSGILTPTTKSNLHYQIGRLLHRSGQLDQAIHHLSETIKYTPSFIEAYLQIGETLQMRREYTKAMRHLEKANKINPTDHRPLLAAGLLCKESKDYAEAEKYLRRAASLAPKDIYIQRQLAQVIALALIHNPLHEKV